MNKMQRIDEVTEDTLILRPNTEIYKMTGHVKDSLPPYMMTYYDKKKRHQVSILEHGEYHMGPIQTQKIQMSEKRLDWTTRYEYRLVYNPQDKDSPLTKEAEFILADPRVYNKNLQAHEQHENYAGKPHFIVERLSITESRQFEETESAFNGMQRFFALSADEWFDCGLFMGIDPNKVSGKILISKLATPQTGLIFTEPGKFNSYLVSKESNQVQLAVQKAISLNVLRADPSGMYTHKGISVGRNSGECANFYTGKIQHFDALNADIDDAISALSSIKKELDQIKRVSAQEKGNSADISELTSKTKEALRAKEQAEEEARQAADREKKANDEIAELKAKLAAAQSAPATETKTEAKVQFEFGSPAEATTKGRATTK